MDTLDQHWSSQYAQGKDFKLARGSDVDFIVAHTNNSAQKIALDIGCGTGQLTRELYHRGFDCVGIDSSSEAIRLARNRTVQPSLSYHKADILDASFDTIVGNKRFSLITCKLVLAFISDKSVLIEKIANLLLPKGTFVVITPVHEGGVKTPIGVDASATQRLLAHHFSDVTATTRDGLMYFVCK